MDDNLALAIQVVEEDDEDYRNMMMAAAQAAVAVIMDLEEGVGLDATEGPLWVPITINISEYHLMGDPCFATHFRMSRGVFECLVVAVGNHLVENNRLQRERTPLQDILLMVIWIMATPDSFRRTALSFGVHPSTLHYFYTYIIEALREMAEQYIRWPSEEERRGISRTFERVTGFPGVVGSIDCTHVYVTAPVVDAAAYRNRHHSYSLNVQCIVDSTLLVRDLHVGECGSMHDARVFRRSPVYEDLIVGNNERRLSPDEHLVGDGAYTLTDFMMIPFENNCHLNALQLIFNRRLSQCRVRVENAFGRAKGKWRRLKFLHALNQAYVVDYITATFMLHNFTVINGEPLLDEDELQRPLNPHEVLGDEGFDADDEFHPLLEAAQGRGVEKRLFIMNNVLPMPEQD